MHPSPSHFPMADGGAGIMACIFLRAVHPLQETQNPRRGAVQWWEIWGCSYRALISVTGCAVGPWHYPSLLTLSLLGTPWEGQGCEDAGGCAALGPTMPCTPL